jgi:quercetin dioxygenase-like cupin family protein
MNRPTYTPQQMEIICQTPEVRVAEITLPPFGQTPSHRHSRANEVCYCLEGELTWQTPDAPDGILHAGQRRDFPVDSTHRLANLGNIPCRLLLIHSGGEFDFVEV